MRIRTIMGIALLVTGFLGLIVPAIEAVEITVDCGSRQSVQAALDSLTGPATIVVTGTCQEYLDIKKDDVTIRGGNYLEPSPPDSTQSIIYVLSARRVLITEVTVTGGSNGIYVDKGGSLTLDGNSTISGAANNGVVSAFGSSVAINSSTIQGNLRGVIAIDNSALTLTNSTITANVSAGVLVQRASSARIGRSMAGVLGPNEITYNGGSGVNVFRSAYALIDGNTITGNTGNGVHIEGASATVTNNTIANNQNKGIVVTSSGNARIGITEGDQSGKNIIENNVYEGIEISNSAAAFTLANTIRLNGLTTGRTGISINRASGRLMGDNMIQGNGGHGVGVNLGELFQGVGDFFNLTPGPDIITQNGYSGISGWNGARLDIRFAEVTNNVQNGIVLSLQSTLRIYGSTVSGHSSPYNGIYVNRGSAVIFDHPSDTPPAIVTTNTGWGVFCGDMESSYTGDTSRVTGNGPKGKDNVNCTGF